MKSRIYNLFSKSFPEFSISEDVFFRLLDFDNCTVIPYYDEGILAGCSVVQGNCIRLLCVSPDHRRTGIGTSLLCDSEKLIAEKGFKQAILGGRDSGLFIGETVPIKQPEGSETFWERKGYAFDDGCIEMKMPLAEFDSSGLNIPACPVETVFGYIEKNERNDLLSAVSEVDSDWVQYFTPESQVFAARLNGKIAGFCMIDENADTIISNGSNNVCSIGCVGVIPEMRKNGIGLSMVAKAAHIAKCDGCTDAFIHYTYLDKWYGRLGFKTFLRYRFSEKKL